MLLKWLLKQEVSAIPKSGTSTRILNNMHLFDFDISEEDMQKLSSLSTQVGGLLLKPNLGKVCLCPEINMKATSKGDIEHKMMNQHSLI